MPKNRRIQQRRNEPRRNQPGRRAGNRIKRSSLELFVKTFVISTGVLLVLIISGWSLLRGWIKPPEIPAQVLKDEPDAPYDWSDSAFVPLHGDEADKSIGGGLPAPERFSPLDRKDLFYTFLIVGLDSGTSTDTIMVASYDGVSQTADIIAVPRDSLVNVKRRVKKINAAYGAGTLDGGGREGGVEQLKREIKTIIGFEPDFYVLIDLNAFVKIVDSLKGVEIDVPVDMDYDDPTPGQDLHIHIKKGYQTLDGKEALEFARYRKGNNGSSITDYQRIENQQAVISAVAAKLLKPESILKIKEFIDIFNEYVYSDIKMESMLWFAEELNKIKGTDALSMHTIPTTGTSGPNQWYEFLDEAAIVELVNRTANPYLEKIEAKDLDILTEVP